MKAGIDKKLFFSMTMDFLEVYLPQGHESSKTVKAYRDGLTVFRRYLSEVQKISIRISCLDNARLIWYLITEIGLLM